MLRRLILSIMLGGALVAVPAATANTRPLTLKQGRKAISAVFFQEAAYGSGISHAHLVRCHKTGRLTVVCDSYAQSTSDGVTAYCHKYYRAHRGRSIKVVESRTGKAPWYRYTASNCHE